MALPVKSEKREDKLPLERALRALEDARKSLKQFSATESVAANDALNAEHEIVRPEAAQARDGAREPLGPECSKQILSGSGLTVGPRRGIAFR
jgi:hypothetical protein